MCNKFLTYQDIVTLYNDITRIYGESVDEGS